MKRIFDPVHRFIELDDAEARLLDTVPMQRLRRLRQLGLAYLAYPSAEHSRFTHALGALAVGTRVFDSLRTHSSEFFTDVHDAAYQRRLLRAALLLHDVGHGPFSHACEAVLGVAHEHRTRAILELPDVRAALAEMEVAPSDVCDLITHAVRDSGAPARNVLSELVSGPNLDADRMDYLLRDSYFTGVASGRYDSEQLLSSLRVYSVGDGPILGVDSRGVVALESFVLARYMMFATVYFHHTTRMFERVLQEALREVWSDPRKLDDIEEFLAWDDFRVIDRLRTSHSPAAAAMRERRRLYAVAAEFNAEADLQIFERCHQALEARWPGAVWADSQEQLMHRLPLGAGDERPTVYVGTAAGVFDAREVSDLIRRISGKAFWRKLFVDRGKVNVEEARAVCRSISTRT